ncbi:MAG TPA: hypothetical protein VHO70_25000 [Chitinispirillaceae bacterium]|nr:hypothetical protein [Chitinispirillaceae bacterium]
MRKLIHYIVPLILLFIAGQTQAQSTVSIDGPLLSAGQYIAIADNCAPVPDFSAEYDKEEHRSKPGGIVAGSLLLSGGIAMGITGQIIGKKTYSKYLRSAFTDNTNRLRKRVMKYNVMRVAGGICAGSGLFILIFSF